MPPLALPPADAFWIWGSPCYHWWRKCPSLHNLQAKPRPLPRRWRRLQPCVRCQALDRAGAATGLMEWYSERLETAPDCSGRGPHNHVYFTAPLLATDAPGRLVEVGA